MDLLVSLVIGLVFVVGFFLALFYNILMSRRKAVSQARANIEELLAGPPARPRTDKQVIEALNTYNSYVASYNQAIDTQPTRFFAVILRLRKEAPEPLPPAL